ncbi:RES domain-containing protein [Frankia gtarii]|uniref:RES domain-containing protein n=1 Tax=Frankia gtarii TaxID=2950102 RepID=UPI0021C0AEA9|nr:RES domain-containing protein [Frankia gtarii]
MADHVGTAPRLQRESDLFVAVEGGFFRAVDPAYLDDALVGSRGAGRYSPPGRPTLYMSASPEGVNVAMIAHAADRAPEPALIGLSVTASCIVDLRDPVAPTVRRIPPRPAASTDSGDEAAAGPM